MARDLNQVIIIGRLVRQPEVRYTANGLPVAKFSIANNEVFNQGNEKKEIVNYFDIVVWGNQAVNCEKYLNKGSQVAIDGRLRQNRWDDPSGQKRSKVEIIASSVQFLSPNQGQREGNQQVAYGNTTGQFNTPIQKPAYNQQVNVKPQQSNNENSFIVDPWSDSSSSETPLEDYQDYGSEDDIPF